MIGIVSALINMAAASLLSKGRPLFCEFKQQYSFILTVIIFTYSDLTTFQKVKSIDLAGATNLFYDDKGNLYYFFDNTLFIN